MYTDILEEEKQWETEVFEEIVAEIFQILLKPPEIQEVLKISIEPSLKGKLF